MRLSRSTVLRQTAPFKMVAGIAVAAALVAMITTIGTVAQTAAPETGDVAAPAAAANPLPRPKPTPGADNDLPPGFEPAPAADTAVIPYAPPFTAHTGTPSDENEGTVYLVSRLTEDSAPLNRGMVWRVYTDSMNDEGKLTLVANAAGGDAEFRLEPGSYLIHAGFGYAGSTARVTVDAGRVRSKTIVLNAGGLKLGAELADSRPLDMEQVTFDVYANDPEAPNGRRMIVSKAKPDTMLRLNADSYYVVSYYGGVNAVVRADIRVQPGKLTEATVYHKAAQVTLKLVNEPGGEALANTAWSVLTPGGDQLVESIGAFPSFILAEGDYAVVAKHNEEIYNRSFSVESGIDREVEVTAAR